MSDPIKTLESRLRERHLRPGRRLEILRQLAEEAIALDRALEVMPTMRRAYTQSQEREDRQTELELLRLLAHLECQTGNLQAAIDLLRLELHRRSSRGPDYFSQLAENYFLQAEIFEQLQREDTARIYYQHCITYAGCWLERHQDAANAKEVRALAREAEAALQNSYRELSADRHLEREDHV